VNSKIETLPTGEQVSYFIVKGPRRKVADVEIVGNQTLSSKALAGHVKVEKGKFPLISRGKFSEQLMRTSANNLKRVYESEGFSSVQVTPEVSDTSGNVGVKFRVNEGRAFDSPVNLPDQLGSPSPLLLPRWD
jgi:outer membrane protein assembly factor BamA